MPYIDQISRAAIDCGSTVITPGELNYAISKLVDTYLVEHGGVNYKNINEAIGVLECAKLELYRRLAAPYEDEKIAQNGEVYYAAA